MATAAVDYGETQLSPNIGETDEGFLVCRNVVLARTGFQTYKGRELPAKQLAKLGITVGPDEELELYRSPEEVFRPGFLSTLESKPLTDEHPPGDTFVDAENIDEYGKGHIRNIRRGEEPLDDGNWPLVGDVYSTHADLVDGIKFGKRGISLGYLYDLARDGERICQVNLIGNHAAVVHKGRAGSEARIKDAAPEVAAIAKPQPITKPKERTTMSKLMELLGLGLRA